MLAGVYFCNKAEKNYAPIKGEATAVARGRHQVIHGGLPELVRGQSLEDVKNPRLASIKERTLWWQIKIIHTPGKQQLAADALGRRKSKLSANITDSLQQTVR